MWVFPSVGSNDQQDLMVLFHLLLCTVLSYCSPRELWSCHETTLRNESRTKNLCESWNRAFQSLVGLSHPTPWKLIINLRKTICKLRHLYCWTPEDSIRMSVCKPQPESSNRHSTHSVLRSEMGRKISPLPWELSGTVSGGSSDSDMWYLLFVCFMSFNYFFGMNLYFLKVEHM